MPRVYKLQIQIKQTVLQLLDPMLQHVIVHIVQPFLLVLNVLGLPRSISVVVLVRHDKLVNQILQTQIIHLLVRKHQLRLLHQLQLHHQQEQQLVLNEIMTGYHKMRMVLVLMVIFQTDFHLEDKQLSVVIHNQRDLLQRFVMSLVRNI